MRRATLLACVSLLACDGVTVDPVVTNNAAQRSPNTGGAAGSSGGAGGSLSSTGGLSSGGTGEAGSASAGSGGSSQPANCVRDPSASERPDVDGESLEPIYLAWSELRFEGDAGELVFEHDYDWAWCNDLPTTPACVGNQFGHTVLAPEMQGPLSKNRVTQQDLNCELHRGSFSVLLRLNDYSGEANDGYVTVDILASDGLEVLPEWRCSEVDDWASETQWKATDPWRLVQPVGPFSWHLEGFVRDGKLSAWYRGGKHFQLWLDGSRDAASPGLQLELKTPTVIGTLGKADGNWSLTQGFFASLLTFDWMPLTLLAQPMCDDMCTTWDLMYQTEDPNRSYGCQRPTLALEFEAREATPGEGVQKTAQPVCPDTDQCGG